MLDNNKIRALRTKRNMTLEDLSRKSEVGYFTLQRIETGYTKDPGINNIARIAKALQTKVDDLLIS